MASHALARDERRLRRPRNSVTTLGWTHFWLMVAVLGGLLGLIAMGFVVSLART